MKKNIYLICLLISLSSCGDKFMKANLVTIKITEPIGADSWIEIDGHVFYHFTNDTISPTSKDFRGQDFFIPKSLVSKYPDYIFLPASTTYNWADLGNSWLSMEASNAEMAASYVATINQWQVKEVESFDVSDRIYLFPNNQFELFKGEVTFGRADKQPMKIKRSKNYNAQIIAVE